MKNLNENEAKVLRTICEGCDEIDGWGFHRPSMLMVDVMREFDRIMQNKRREIGSTSDGVAAAYRTIWKEYCDNMRHTTKDTGFKWLTSEC